MKSFSWKKTFRPRNYLPKRVYLDVFEKNESYPTRWISRERCPMKAIVSLQTTVSHNANSAVKKISFGPKKFACVDNRHLPIYFLPSSSSSRGLFSEYPVLSGSTSVLLSRSYYILPTKFFFLKFIPKRK